VEPLSAATTATAVAPASAVATANPVVPDKAEKPAASVGRGQGIVILGLATALVILGLWFVLSRNTGEMKQVDAAEPNASRTQPVEQPGTSAASASSGLGTASASGITDSLRELRQRAQAGDSESQFELGAKYATGEEIPQDYPEAVKWFTRAAEGGQVLAAATLGAYYWAGRGVPRDDVSAYMWSSIARLEGDEASRYRIAILRARMTAQQIMEGEQRTARWREAHFRAFSTATALTPQ
jgi:TPR repeat protein